MNLPTAFFTGMPGVFEVLIVSLVVLLLFGNRLPSVMRSMGRGIVEFKKGVQGIEDDVNDAVKNDNPPAAKDTDKDKQ